MHLFNVYNNPTESPLNWIPHCIWDNIAFLGKLYYSMIFFIVEEYFSNVWLFHFLTLNWHLWILCILFHPAYLFSASFEYWITKQMIQRPLHCQLCLGKRCQLSEAMIKCSPFKYSFFHLLSSLGRIWFSNGGCHSQRKAFFPPSLDVNSSPQIYVFFPVNPAV